MTTILTVKDDGGGDEFQAQWLPEQFESIEQAIGVPFHNRNLLQRAFKFPSALRQVAGRELTPEERVSSTNAQLEYFGRGVLAIVLAMIISERKPDITDKRLGEYVGGILEPFYLCRIFETLRLDSFLVVGRMVRQQFRHDSNVRIQFRARAIYALFGALFIDRKKTWIFWRRSLSICFETRSPSC